MTNKEKNKDKIVDIAAEGDIVAVDRDGLKLVPCNSIGCLQCLFDTYNYPDNKGGALKIYVIG